MPTPALPRGLGLLVSLVVTLGAAGCPHNGGAQDLGALPRLTTEDPVAEEELRQAEEAAEAGRDMEARTRYEDFLREFPDDPLRPLALLGLGRVFLARGELDTARALFAEAALANDPAVAEQGRFHEGLALHLMGRSAQALERLEPLAGRLPDPVQRVLLLRTLAAAGAREDRYDVAFSALDRLIAAEDLEMRERDEGRVQLRELVESAPPEAVEAAYGALPRVGEAWPEVARRALRLAFDRGEMDRVTAIVQELRAQGTELSPELAELALRAERTEYADPRVIGAILPLSGRGRLVGQQTVRGLMLAAGLPGTGPVDEHAAQLIVRDDGGDPARAAQAVEDLVSVHRAIAIVGPLSGPTARAAAERAEALGVPLLTLVPDPRVVESGPRVFRLFPGPAEEAAGLVAAARRRGVTRFAILRPDSSYGEAMAEAFAVAVGDAGGRVVWNEAYGADATSFGREIEALAAAQPEALFVPDRASRIALIAPALAAADLWSRPENEAPPRGGRAIVLLASSAALDARPLAASARYVQGLLVASPFLASAATGVGQRFVDAYRDAYADSPSRYAAFGYDAFRLLRSGVDAGQTRRDGLAGWLSTNGAAATAGASGGLGSHRGPAGGARVVELRDGVFAPLNGEGGGDS